VKDNVQILIVEDEILVAMSMQMELEDSGYSVCGIAATGDKAIEMIKTIQPDIVLMDVNLSGSKNGINTAIEIRNFSNTPIIFLTGYSDKMVTDTIIGITNTSHLIKPTGINSIQTEIDKLLSINY